MKIDHYEQDRKFLIKLMWKLGLFLIVIGAVFGLFIKAVDSHQNTVRLTKGLLCDTKGQVIEFMDDLFNLPEGCGYVQRPIQIHLTLLEEGENDTHTFILVQYDIPFSTGELGIQYGVMNTKIKTVKREISA